MSAAARNPKKFAIWETPMAQTNVLLSLLWFAAVALAGCTSDDGGHSHGEFTCDDGTVLQEGNFTDHHDEGFDLATNCPGDPLPVISVVLNVDAASTVIYQALSFSWDITPNEAEASHSMLTEVRASTTSVSDDSLAGAGPDSYGEVVGRMEHQNTPADFTGEWSPTVAGTYYLRAYAEDKTDHFWSPEVMVEVADLLPTGVVHEVTIGPGGPLASFDPADLTIQAGDAVMWTNGDLDSHQIVSMSGPVDFDTGAIAMQSSSEAIVFLAPGSYAYSDMGTLQDATGQAASGTITVQI